MNQQTYERRRHTVDQMAHGRPRLGRLALLFIVQTALPGCFDDPAGTETADADAGAPAVVETFEDMMNALTAGFCGRMFECCAQAAEPPLGLASEAECRSVLLPELSQELREDTLRAQRVMLNGQIEAIDWATDTTYDPAWGTECIRLYRTSVEQTTCAEADKSGAARDWDARPCEWAVGGPVPEGESCVVYADETDTPDGERVSACQAGLVCPEGRCVPPGGSDAPCDADSDCTTGFDCGEGDRCAARVPAKAIGEPCTAERECGQNGCESGVCVEPPGRNICDG
jgi:hypothetical protein